ncbi:MAG: C-GCAxxG-C-C family protein [Lachnospiraceae bacterium]|nr:C-GCAxxG-C-C family protein [Lachnospiraceae bacterium]
MGQVTDRLYEIYVTQETNCAETMLRAGTEARSGQTPEACCRMMSGFSGGVSSECFCGAILGGVSAISYLINQGDDESFEKSKEATEEFVAQCKEFFGSLDCHDIKSVWRQEEIRCYQAVEKIAVFLNEVLDKYCPEETV